LNGRIGLTQQKTWQLALLLLLVVGAVWAMVRWLPPAYDMHTFFRPALHSWMNHEFVDANWPDLNYTPWELMFFLPFALPPEPVGRALFLIFAVVVMVWAARQVERRRLALALTLVSFPALAMFWQGNMEPFPILGAALSAWAIQTRRPWALSLGLLLLTTKPQEAFLLVPVMLWAIRRWRRDEWLQVAIGPVIMLVLTAALFDWGWLFKVLRAPGGYQSHWTWINISIWWRFAPYWVAWLCSLSLAGAGLWFATRLHFDRYVLALVTAFQCVASPYVATHHLALPMVLGWPWLLDRKPRLAFLVYVTSLTPLLRLGGDQTINWLDSLFPITLMLALLLFFREQRLAEG
jgi:hypothetical protein